jgi:NAD-dependent dihydropyrimidine dehydrogenase PreA subunit
LKVFEEGEKNPKIAKPEKCIACRACEAQCPAEAIELEE